MRFSWLVQGELDKLEWPSLLFIMSNCLLGIPCKQVASLLPYTSPRYYFGSRTCYWKPCFVIQVASKPNCSGFRVDGTGTPKMFFRWVSSPYKSPFSAFRDCAISFESTIVPSFSAWRTVVEVTRTGQEPCVGNHSD